MGVGPKSWKWVGGGVRQWDGGGTQAPSPGSGGARKAMGWWVWWDSSPGSGREWGGGGGGNEMGVGGTQALEVVEDRGGNGIGVMVKPRAEKR